MTAALAWSGVAIFAAVGAYVLLIAGCCAASYGRWSDNPTADGRHKAELDRDGAILGIVAGLLLVALAIAVRP